MVEPDPEVQAAVDRYNREFDGVLDQPLGRTETALDTPHRRGAPGRIGLRRPRRHAMRAATGAAIALTNGGGIRGNRLYPPGTVLTTRDVMTELPFGNTTVLVAITGAQVRAALENGFHEGRASGGPFPQVSGLRVTVDAAAKPGKRVREVTVAGEPLDPLRVYEVAANSFMFGGGNGYGCWRKGAP